MSITFYVRGITGGYSTADHVCDEDYCDPAYFPPGVTECPGDWIDAGVNMSNTNARSLMADLGLPDDYVGTIEADRLLDLCVGALTEIEMGWKDDSGVATVTGRARGDSGCTVHDCGVEPGYKARQIGALADLARQAQSLGLPIDWA